MEAVQLWKQTIRGEFYNVATSFHTKSPPKLLSGGILADDMGLGKTLQIISLILTGGAGTTLIVAPKGVMSNWEQQIARHVRTTRAMKVATYHDSAKFARLAKKFSDFDVVITSYGKLAQGGELAAYKWRRVVLDEGHTIRNANTQAAQAACNLKAQSRWVLTGTPM
jgi:SWI/SNF-related matrix-associated actin-dependent regulator of chromatin subfamily A3